MSGAVTYQAEQNSAVITIDDGKMNVITRPLLTELNTAFDRAEQEGARVILTGRPGVFSAGFDLKVLQTGGMEAVKLLVEGFAFAERVASFARPVVVACPGHAIAMGLFIVLAADYRFAARGAYKFTANEVATGMIIPRAAVELCRRRLTPQHFQRTVVLAEVYDPETAVQAGFVDEVVDPAGLLARAHDFAHTLVRLDMRAHAQAKLRARIEPEQTLHAAIAGDRAEFHARALESTPA